MNPMPLDKVDELFVEAGQIVINRGQCSISLIQRELKIGYTRAGRLAELLTKAGVFRPVSNYPTMGKTCITQRQWEEYLKECENFEGEWQSEGAHAIRDITDCDSMTGEEFEHFCADILRKNGFDSVGFTATTGDHGVDLTASKDELRYVFQCKCYSSTVGNAAIQEVYSGKSIYNADVAVVITNSYFTNQAKKDADRLRVFLWDRNKLSALIAKLDSRMGE